MTRSIRRFARAAALAAAAASASGCVTGHLFDAARRRERPVEVREASLDGDRLVLGYLAIVSDDRGDARERVERRAAVPLTQLRDASRPTDAFAVERLAPGPPLPGRALPIVRTGEAPPATPYLELVAGDEAGSPVVALHGADGRTAPGFPTVALLRTMTRAWAYPLLPVGVAFDVATVPPLLLLATPLLWLGD